MNTKRCSWASADNPLLVEYHDREWGVPVHKDRKHFEVLLLSGAQAGLSWSLVLKKREGYRRAFDKFDPEKVARLPNFSTLTMNAASSITPKEV
jgi:DNA-3-methyladenine glycosylase I